MGDHDDHFVMVWGDFWKSSILREDVVTRFVFLACLDECDVDGVFRATPFFLARKCVIPEDQVAEALEALQRPDPDSTHREHDGRRLVSEGSNLWRVPSYPGYRRRAAAAKKRWLARERQKRKRERDDALQGVTECDERDDALESVENRDPVSVSVDVDVDVKDCDGTKGGSKGGKKKKKAPMKPDYTEMFDAVWALSWKRGHKKAAFETFLALGEEDQKDIYMLTARWRDAFERRPADKRPHVSTWLNNRGWEDDLEAELASAKNTNPQVQVGKTEERLPDEERMNRLKQAILEHALHLSELEVPQEVAELFVDAVAGLKALHKEQIGEMALSKRFQDIHDDLLDGLYRSAGAEVPAVNWDRVRAGHKEEEVAKRAFATHCRKAAREHFGINDICEYNWEG